MMDTVLLRLTLLACCAAAAAPADALANATVQFIPEGGLHVANLKVLGDAGRDLITVTESSANFKFKNDGGTLTLVAAADNTCTLDAPTGVVTCPKSRSISIDLAGATTSCPRSA
jgi:hypothetical protein